MKYLVVSDIHGSSESCNIFIEKFNQFNADKIIILGDILYHGPRNDLPDFYNPKKVISLLNPLADKIIAVRGNCDAEVDQMVLDFKIHENFVLDNILLTHGHHINHLNPTSDISIKHVFHGHSHIIKKDVVNNVAYVNIGSITIPKENTARCYGILENDVFSIYDLKDNLILKHSL